MVMEISVIGSSQVKTGKTDTVRRDVRFGNFNSKICCRKSRIGYGQMIGWPSTSSNCFSLKAAAAQLEPVVLEKVSLGRSKLTSGMRLYVGLPLDTVSDHGTVNHLRAVVAGLKALKLLGVDGVELPVWWGIAEKEAMGKYEWSGYLELVELVQKLGLKLHVSLCFHALREPKIPLPKWVSSIGESQPSIFFMDRSGKQYNECLSFGVDDLPVLNGKSPMQVYRELLESFKTIFSSFMGSTITGLSIGLGPDGELRYPSHHNPTRVNDVNGVGEFQCYDQNIISLLKQHADSLGNPLWGLSGPHDAPTYDQLPNSSNFCKEHGGSWETSYGDFFLSWYSSLLISHGNRMLSLASSIFDNAGVTVSGKVPLMQSWYRTRSHPSELTAGFYNTENRDGYEAVAEMFSRNSCRMILPGMDLSDEHQPSESLSSPELLLAQITAACRKHGVEVCGQNSSVLGAPRGLEQIKKNISGEFVVDLFTYQRMGAYFFSPDHFPLFTKFVRDLNQAEPHLDDQPINEEEASESLPGKNFQMHAP